MTETPAYRQWRCLLFGHRSERQGAWNDWACARCGVRLPHGCTCGLDHRPGVCDGGR